MDNSEERNWGAKDRGEGTGVEIVVKAATILVVVDAAEGSCIVAVAPPAQALGPSGVLPALMPDSTAPMLTMHCERYKLEVRHLILISTRLGTLRF